MGDNSRASSNSETSAYVVARLAAAPARNSLKHVGAVLATSSAEEAPKVSGGTSTERTSGNSSKVALSRSPIHENGNVSGGECST